MFLGGTSPSVYIHTGNLIVRTGAREVAVGNCLDLGAIPLLSGQGYSAVRWQGDRVELNACTREREEVSSPAESLSV